MKVSVLIIAHNEERYIERCIRSVFMQTRRPDEVIVVAHNCTDRTELLSRQFAVSIIPYNGPDGTAYARIEGIRHVTGDMILCIDGDAYAAVNWVQKMSDALEQDGAVLVGSWVRFLGPAFLAISNFWNYFFCTRSRRPARWVWGASMAFWKKDAVLAQDMITRSISFSRQLGLTRNPDDYWLALLMQQKGKICITNETWVATDVEEMTNHDGWNRNRENLKNGNRMEEFMRLHAPL